MRCRVVDVDTQRWRQWCNPSMEDAAAGGEGDVRAMLLLVRGEAEEGLYSMKTGDMFAQWGGLTPVECLVRAEVYLCWANARRGEVSEALWASYMPSESAKLCEQLRRRVAQWFKLVLQNPRKKGPSFGGSDDRCFDRCLNEVGRYLGQVADSVSYASCMPDTSCSYLTSRMELCEELRRQLQQVPDSDSGSDSESDDGRW